MKLTPVYRVCFMEAHNLTDSFTHEITLEPISSDEIKDLASGRSCEDGYEKPETLSVHVSEQVFHSLRVGMVYEMAFISAKLPEVA